MSDLQYVGARYVPKFYENSLDPSSPAWESGVGYEGFTVVTYLGDSYTSKKPVPGTVGDPASNPQYWAKTGEFNAALLALQNRMSNAENDIDNLETRADNLETRVDNIFKKRVITIGDSYNTTITPAGGSPIVPWGPIVLSMLGATGSDGYDSGVSGSGFIGAGGAATFLDQLTVLTPTVTDKDTITDIIVSGGTNDNAASDSDINDAISAFVTYAHSNYPNAKIWVIAGNWGVRYAHKDIMRRMSTIYHSRRLTGIATFDAFPFIHYAGFFQPDGGHLLLSGSRALAAGIANKISGGEGAQPFYGNITVDNTAAGSTSFTGFNIQYQQYGDCVFFKSLLVGNISSYVSGKTIPLGPEFKIGEQSSPHLTGNALFSDDSVIIAVARVIINNSISGTLYLSLKRNEVYLQIAEDTWSADSITISTMYVRPSTPITLSLFET